MADIEMPQLGETVTEGTVTRWFKAVGDPVAEDEVLFEVSTDKVDSEVPSPVAGYLAEIKVPEGETVDVGTVLAVVSDAPAAGAAPPAQTDEDAAPAPPPPPPAAAAPTPAPAPAPRPRRPHRRRHRPLRRLRLRLRLPLLRPRRRPAAPGRRGQGAVAGGATPDHRARARPERHPGHRRGRTGHPQRRAAGDRVASGGRVSARRGRPGRRGRRARRGRPRARGRATPSRSSTTSAASPASTWCGRRPPRPTP